MSATASRGLRIALLNPNTDAQATRLMLESARRAVPVGATIEGRTAPRGAALIVSEAMLAAAAAVVGAYGHEVAEEGFDGLVIAGFGDPGLDALKVALSIPVCGIAEAGIAEAGADGRRYSIVTITHDLHDSLRSMARRYGHGDNLMSVRFTEAAAGAAAALAADHAMLEQALLAACRRAVDEDGARAIVIGGGPLARAAEAIAPQIGVPLVEPVAAALRRLVRMLRDRGRCSGSGPAPLSAV